VMRATGQDRHACRLRGLIVALWRAGLRIHEALALNEPDLDRRGGSLLVPRARAAAAVRSAWTSGPGSNCSPGSTSGSNCLSARCSVPQARPPLAAAAVRADLHRTAMDVHRDFCDVAILDSCGGRARGQLPQPPRPSAAADTTPWPLPSPTCECVRCRRAAVRSGRLGESSSPTAALPQAVGSGLLQDRRAGLVRYETRRDDRRACSCARGQAWHDGSRRYAGR
jgi:hypothetical protein